MNLIKYLIVIGAVLTGGFGAISILMYESGGAWLWLPWPAFIASFILWEQMNKTYGIGSASTLWVSGIVLIVGGFVRLFGHMWGEIMSNSQIVAAIVVLIGTFGLSLTRPRIE